MSPLQTELRVLQIARRDVWHVVSRPRHGTQKPDVDFSHVLRELVKCHRLPEQVFLAAWRGISIDCLPSVLTTGIDVSPTDSPIFVDTDDKAIAYGGWPKLLLALDRSRLEPTWQEVAANLPDDEIEVMKRKYPTMLRSQDGTHLWFSRLSDADRRTSTQYEVAYARYIAGDANAALLALFVFAGPEWSPAFDTHQGR